MLAFRQQHITVTLLQVPSQCLTYHETPNPSDMKKISSLLFISAFLTQVVAFGHGVAIKDANAAIYFKLLRSSQSVMVYDQVSTTITTQVFKNLTGEPSVVKYAFPLHEEASATSLRWKVNNIWHTAIFAPEPQDTTLPGPGNPNQNLLTYLGDSPMFFAVPDTVASDSTLTVELTYVELLPYTFGKVTYDYPNDYHLIQTSLVDLQSFHFVLESQRNIDSIRFAGITGATITNNGTHAEINYSIAEAPANKNYRVVYSLAANTIGLYGYSTYLPDSLMLCDSLGNGYFTFIVEPSPDTSEVIPKVFSLVIDHSGSMAGSKMQQAKDAAAYIVNHLNEGDYFNLVAFNESVMSFMPDHVPFTTANKELALNFINNLYAVGSTDIAGVMHVAIGDYAGNDTTVANIMIFLTDGQATTGLLGTEQILASIQNDVTSYEVQYLMINTFGIGSDVNQQLLSQIASQNNGLCQFLGVNDLEAMITQFYLLICNPVLLNVSMTFDPPIVSETYPEPLPNLYIGQQLILAGRYDSILTTPLQITMTGHAFGQMKTYYYEFQLADSLIQDYMFTTKLWAIRKIDHLYIEYFTYPMGSNEADSIKELIIQISTCYNVSSPFTHFGAGGTTSIEEFAYPASVNGTLKASPNPFTDEVTMEFSLNRTVAGEVRILIYDLYGKLIAVIGVPSTVDGQYKVVWNGRDLEGRRVPAGFYTCRIHNGDEIITGKLVRME